MANPTRINQGGAQNQERQSPEQTGEFGEQQRETGEPVKGPKPLNIPEDKKRVLSEQAPGEARTPDKTIGQVKYADHEGGGEQKHQRGSTRTTPLTPEKQGGIGGP
jgi:hypothetical protein